MYRHQQSSRGELHSAADCQRCVALFICFFNQLLCLYDFLISCFVYMYAFLISCLDYFELFAKSFAFFNQLFSIIQQAGRGCFIQFTNLTLFVPAVNINLTLTDFQNPLNILMYVYHFVINVGRRNIDWLIGAMYNIFPYLLSIVSDRSLLCSFSKMGTGASGPDHST